MNNPCNEDWNGMEPTEQGRFCNSCQKPVIDFTHFTDQQIREYFLQHPFPVCGRMLNTQQDQHYSPSTSKTNRHISPVAATLLTLATITTEAAHSEAERVKPLQEQTADKQILAVPADSVIISGTVKAPDGNPLENAEITFEEYRTLSDKDGNFQFTLPAAIIKPGVIQFSFEGLERQVRSYHPLMGSTSYEVRFPGADFSVNYSMGIMIPSFNLPECLSTFSFQSSNRLNTKTTALLSQVALYLKDNPDLKIMIRSYYKRSRQKATKLSNLIKSYLEDQEGVNSERFVLANPQLQKDIPAEVIIDFTSTDE